jgi:hypothetical protein
MNNEEDGLIDDLILSGALEIAGVDDKTGQFLYSITSKMKDLMPDLYKEYMQNINKELMILWEKGFIDIDLMEDDPTVFLTKKSLDEDEISQLDKDQMWSLSEIKRISDFKI